MRDWKAGDKLLCINAMPENSASGIPTNLVAGEEYTLQDIHTCHGSSGVDVGIPYPEFIRQRMEYCICSGCKMTHRTRYFWAWRFIKIDPRFKLEDEEHERQLDKLRKHAMNYNIGPAIFNKLEVPNS